MPNREDSCIVCFERLATMISESCQCRNVCFQCSNRLNQCPICATHTSWAQDDSPAATADLFNMTNGDNGDIVDIVEPIRAEDPFEHDPAYVQARQMVLDLISQGRSLDEIQRELGNELSYNRFRQWSAHLLSIVPLGNTDLLQVLELRETTRFSPRILVQSLLSAPNATAAMSQATLSAVPSILNAWSATPSATQHSMMVFSTADFTSAMLLPAVFIGVEAYRWSRGELTGLELAQAVFEHTSSGVCSALGMNLGASVGAVFGKVAFWGIFGGIAGGVFAALLGRFLARKVGEKCWMPKDSAKAALIASAQELNIDLRSDSFEVARLKFRERVLKTHPDRLSKVLGRDPTENETLKANEKAAAVIMAWNIVRESFPEDVRQDGHIELVVRSVRETAKHQWRVVRCWASNLVPGEVLGEAELTKTETRRLYLGN